MSWCSPSVAHMADVLQFLAEHAVGIANRDTPGGRNIMWSTDYLQSETTSPRSQAEIKVQFAGVPEADRRAIVHDNARRSYGL